MKKLNSKISKCFNPIFYSMVYLIPVSFASWIIIILTIFLLRIIIQKHIALAYVKGMSEYTTLNWKGNNEINDIWLAIKDEWIEVLEAYQDGNLLEVFFELLDVWHGLVKLAFSICLGKNMIYPIIQPIVYFIMYSLCWVTSDKHGNRYLGSNCIRSVRHHNNDNNSKTLQDHFCHFRL